MLELLLVRDGLVVYSSMPLKSDEIINKGELCSHSIAVLFGGLISSAYYSTESNQGVYEIKELGFNLEFRYEDGVKVRDLDNPMRDVYIFDDPNTRTQGLFLSDKTTTKEEVKHVFDIYLKIARQVNTNRFKPNDDNNFALDALNSNLTYKQICDALLGKSGQNFKERQGGN